VGLTGYDALGRPAGQIGGPLQPGGELQQRLAELLGPLDRNEVPRITEHHLAPGRQARAKFGDVFLDYYLRMKRAELARYEAYLAETGTDPTAGVTEWEVNEYLDFF